MLRNNTFVMQQHVTGHERQTLRRVRLRVFRLPERPYSQLVNFCLILLVVVVNVHKIDPKSSSKVFRCFMLLTTTLLLYHPTSEWSQTYDLQ